MLDIELVRNEPDRIKELCATRAYDVDVDALLSADRQWRESLAQAEELNRELKTINRKVVSGEITKEDAARKSEQARELSAAAKQFEASRDDLLARLPNLLAPDTPPGTSDADNVELRTWGEPTDADPDTVRHDTVGAEWGWYDQAKGAQVAQSGYIYWLDGAGELLWDLFDATLRALRRRGFKQMFTPVVAKDETFFNTGYLPFVSDELYTIEEEPLSLIGTSEQTIIGYFAGEQVPLERLPILVTAFTPCFRTEAGAAGSKSRGAFRVHQFHKVEQIVVCAPEESDRWLDACQQNVEDICKALELPHRVVRVCVGDMGAPAYKKYDTETWFAGFGEFRETHSNSNLTDFQSRRLRLRAKSDAGRVFPHTISATAVTDRVFVALFEDLLARGLDADGALAEGRRRIEAVADLSA
jgi:seryl-tRNA synthetase